jgi:archaellum component FlaC
MFDFEEEKLKIERIEDNLYHLSCELKSQKFENAELREKISGLQKRFNMLLDYFNLKEDLVFFDEAGRPFRDIKGFKSVKKCETCHQEIENEKKV